MWDKEFGIDTFSYYHKLTSKQKNNVTEQLKKLPEFYTVTSNYLESTYAYFSDRFVDHGVRIWIRRSHGKPWGLLIVVHPTLVLGCSDRSALYQPRNKKGYREIVENVDDILDSLKVPCSIDKMKLYRVDVTVNQITRPVRKPSESMLEVKDAANERGAKAKLFTFIAVA